jgi:hypothetical protein
VEALKILEFFGHEFRAALARGTKDEATRVTLEGLNALKPSDYQAQVGSTHNRFQRLLRNVSLRAAFGQTEVSFDFGQALREGSIVLVSLATESGTVMENARSKVVFSLSLRERGTSRPSRIGFTPAPMTPPASSTSFTAPRSWTMPRRRGRSPGAQRREERPGTRRGGRP